MAKIIVLFSGNCSNKTTYHLHDLILPLQKSNPTKPSNVLALKTFEWQLPEKTDPKVSSSTSAASMWLFFAVYSTDFLLLIYFSTTKLLIILQNSSILIAILSFCLENQDCSE